MGGTQRKRSWCNEDFLIGETRGGVADVAIEWWSDG